MNRAREPLLSDAWLVATAPSRTFEALVAADAGGSWPRALAVLPFAIATWYVQRHWAAHGLLEFFVQVAAILPLAIVGAWFFAVDHEDRTAIRVRLQRLRRSAA